MLPVLFWIQFRAILVFLPVFRRKLSRPVYLLSQKKEQPPFLAVFSLFLLAFLFAVLFGEPGFGSFQTVLVLCLLLPVSFPGSPLLFPSLMEPKESILYDAVCLSVLRIPPDKLPAVSGNGLPFWSDVH